jgi:hypothetical protein
VVQAVHAQPCVLQESTVEGGKRVPSGKGEQALCATQDYQNRLYSREQVDIFFTFTNARLRSSFGDSRR